jgi:hypothetical protein
MGLTTHLFRRMLHEEWRLHQHLFGSRRFAAFPVAVFVVSLAGFQLLGVTDTDFPTVVGGLHALVAFFGLQVGTIGLVGRDALRNVLGDVTLLVFSARTLPVSWNRLLGVFLVKDLVYYAAFFIAPIGLAAVPSALGVGFGAAGAGTVAAPRILLLWVTLVGAFGLGVSLSLTLAAVATRSRVVLVAAVAALTAGILLLGVDVVAYTPYGLYQDPSLFAAVRGFAPVALLGVGGPLLFQPARGRAQRTAPERFTRLRNRLHDEHGLTTRALIDVSRSSGSVTKVLFSMGVLFLVTVFLLQEIASATGLEPSPGIAFGTLLGLGAFTTYSWVTQFDDPGEYRRYPVSLADVFAGKRRAYLLLSVPAGLVYLAAGLVWYAPAELAVGVVVLPLVAIYVFGVTAFVAGLSPAELLFDTPLFVGFGGALALVAIPLLVAALVAPVAPTATAVGAVVLSLIAAAVGGWLASRAGPRWERKLRA